MPYYLVSFLLDAGFMDILIAEDDFISRKLLVNILEELGHVVYVANDGVECGGRERQLSQLGHREILRRQIRGVSSHELPDALDLRWI